MKKHNEGYVLPFVLVVLVVVCLVAVSLLSASLTNLNRQQASIDRMEAKYEAQGELEKTIANLKECISGDHSVDLSGTKKFDELTADEKASLKEDAIKKLLSSFGSELDWGKVSDGYFASKELKETRKNVTVSTQIGIFVEIVSIKAPEAEEESQTESLADGLEYTYTYQITVIGEITCASYTISHEEVAG